MAKRGWGRDAWELVRLGSPLVLAAVGAELLGTVDVLMVAPLGKDALGAAAFANAFAIVATRFFVSLLAPIDALVAQARGAGEDGRAGKVVRSALRLSALLAGPLVLLLAYPDPILQLMALRDPGAAGLVSESARFCRALALGIPALLVFSSLRFFVEGHKRPLPGLCVIIGANILNVGANWVLIHGRFGFPALGSTGAALSTAVVQWGMCVAMAGYILLDPALRREAGFSGLRERDDGGARQIVRVGLPIGIREGLRNGFLLLLAAFVAQFGPAELAGYHISLSLVLLANVVALGLNWAVGIQVATDIGAGRPQDARDKIRVAYLVAALVAVAVASVYLLAAGPIGRFYSPQDADVALAAARFLRACAAYQILFAMATVGAGGLFGLLDTRFVAKTVVLAHYLIGLPAAWFFASGLELGPAAVWFGPSLTMVAVAPLLFYRFWQKTAEPETVPARATP